jgi:hypothetical protein
VLVAGRVVDWRHGAGESLNPGHFSKRCEPLLRRNPDKAPAQHFRHPMHILCVGTDLLLCIGIINLSPRTCAAGRYALQTSACAGMTEEASFQCTRGCERTRSGQMRPRDRVAKRAGFKRRGSIAENEVESMGLSYSLCALMLRSSASRVLQSLGPLLAEDSRSRIDKLLWSPAREHLRATAIGTTELDGRGAGGRAWRVGR